VLPKEVFPLLCWLQLISLLLFDEAAPAREHGMLVLRMLPMLRDSDRCQVKASPHCRPRPTGDGPTPALNTRQVNTGDEVRLPLISFAANIPQETRWTQKKPLAALRGAFF
jgi:hypothetical protein